MAEKAHAVLSASGSSIWLNCTKSGELSALPDAPPRKDSVFAAEGTAAHELAETCLRDQKDADLFLNLDFNGFKVSREMADGVQIFVDHCRTLMSGSAYHAVETVVSLKSLWEVEGKTCPTDLYGTADFIAYAGDTLHVVDLKYGAGVIVEAVNNTQLRYYGLGALLHLSEQGYRLPNNVCLTIVQPRAHGAGGPVRQWTIPTIDLLLWADTVIIPTVEAILSGNTAYKTGKHCRWCPIAGRCPELRKDAMQIAKTQFDDVTATPPDPGLISLDDLGAILAQAELISGWVAQVRAAVSHAIDTGKTVNGWKLVLKRATRKWTDEQQVLEILRKEMGSTGIGELCTEPKPLSPAQMEKALKRGFALDLKDMGLDAAITAESSGTTLVPDEDTRSAAPTGPQNAFEDADL